MLEPQLRELIRKFLYYFIGIGIYLSYDVKNRNFKSIISFTVGYIMSYKYINNFVSLYIGRLNFILIIGVGYFLYKIGKVIYNMYNKNNLLEQYKYLYEKEILENKIIEPYENYILRVEFNNIIDNKYLNKPFDEKYKEIMLNISKKIMEEYKPFLINVQYNELNIIFKNLCSQDVNNYNILEYVHLNNGSIIRINNNITDFINNEFNKEIKQTKLKNLKLDIKSKIVFIAEERAGDNEILKYLIERQNMENYKNSIIYFSHNTSKDNFQNQKNHLKYGWLIKNTYLELEKQKLKFLTKKVKVLLAYSFQLSNKNEFKEILMDDIWAEIKLKSQVRNYEVRFIE